MASRSDTPVREDPGIEPPRGGRPRDEAREQAILDAAMDLITEIGFEATSVEAVASRAGVSKATIYRRWPGKAQLVADAVRRMHDESGFSGPDDTGSLRGDLQALVGALCDGMSGADGGLICGLAVAVRADAELGRLLAEQKREHRELTSALIVSRAKARGELPAATEPPVLMDVALGLALFHLMSGEPFDDSFRDHLVDRILLPLLTA